VQFCVDKQSRKSS